MRVDLWDRDPVLILLITEVVPFHIGRTILVEDELSLLSGLVGVPVGCGGGFQSVGVASDDDCIGCGSVKHLKRSLQDE